MPGWVSELLKVLAGAAIGVTVYNIIADNVTVTGGDVNQATHEAADDMAPRK